MAYSQYVIHKGPSPRADLDELNARLWAALRHPLSHEPYADKLTEYLRDLWRSDEVSLLTKLVSALLNGPGVVSSQVTSQAHAHKACKRDRASHLVRPLAFLLIHVAWY